MMVLLRRRQDGMSGRAHRRTDGDACPADHRPSPGLWQRDDTPLSRGCDEDQPLTRSRSVKAGGIAAAVICADEAVATRIQQMAGPRRRAATCGLLATAPG